MAAVAHEGARALGGLKVGLDDGVGFTGAEEWAQDTQTKGKKSNDFENQDHSSGPTKTRFAVLDGLDTEDGWEQRIEILNQTLQTILGPSRKVLGLQAYERCKGNQVQVKGQHSGLLAMQGRGDSFGKNGADGRLNSILKE